jgi:hypothetical protein
MQQQSARNFGFARAKDSEATGYEQGGLVQVAIGATDRIVGIDDEPEPTNDAHPKPWSFPNQRIAT